MCAQACIDGSQCVAASFTGDRGAGMCYLKDRNNGAGASENADGEFSVFEVSRKSVEAFVLTLSSDCD